MDLKGQKLAEIIYQLLFWVLGGGGLVYGYIVKDFDVTVTAWTIAMGLAFVAVLPDFPMYNDNPIKFADSLPDEDVKAYKHMNEQATSAGWFGSATSAAGDASQAASSKETPSSGRKASSSSRKGKRSAS